MAKSFENLFREAEKHLDYWVHAAALELVGELEEAMEAQGVSRAELARRLGTSAAYVTKVLRGDGNFTLETLVKLARALDREVRLHLAPADTVTVWQDVPHAAYREPDGTTSALRLAEFREPVQRPTGRPEPEAGRYEAGVKLKPVASHEEGDDGPTLAA